MLVVNVTVLCAPAAPSSASTVAALASLPDIATVTGPVGCVDSATVYVPLSFSSRPASVEVATRTTRRGSSSVTATVRLADMPVYSLSEAVLAACVTVTLSSTPSSSCAAVSVTVRAVLQFNAVNVSVFCVPGVPPSVSPTVTASMSPLAIVTVTSCVGGVLSRTE